MATRFYLPSSGTPPFSSLAKNSAWELETGLVRLPTFTTKQNTALTSSNRTWASTTTQQWCWFQFQSEQLLSTYSWTTSDTVSMVLGKLAESTTSGDTTLCYNIRVVSADGTTIRGVIGAVQAASGTEVPLTAAAATRIFNAVTTGSTTFSSEIGDRIIIEIGVHGVTPALESIQMRLGDPTATADFALTTALTTDLCSWVQLSRTVSLGVAPIVIQDVTQAQSLENLTPEGVVIDDFQSRTTGSLVGQGDWINIINGTLLPVVDTSGAKTLQISNQTNVDIVLAINKTFADDQYAQVKNLGPVDGTRPMGVAARVSGSGSTWNGYVYAGYEAQRYLDVFVNGVSYGIGMVWDTVNVNDVLKIVCEGTSIKCYKNGVLDSALGSATSPATGSGGNYVDSRLSSGITGVYAFAGDGGYNTQIDDFESGYEEDSAINVTIQDVSQAQSIENIAVTQIHVVEIAGLGQAQSIANVVATQVHVVAIDNINQSQSVENIYTVDSLLQSQGIENITVTQVHVVAIDNVSEAQSIANVVATQVHIVAIDSLSQAQSIENIAVTQVHGVAIDNLSEAQSLENITVTTEAILTIQDIAQSQSIENIAVTQLHVVAIDNVSEAQSIANVVATQVHVVAIDNVAQSQSIANIDVTQVHIVSIDNLSQTQQLEHISNEPAIDLLFDSLAQVQSIESIVISQVHNVLINDLVQYQSIENIAVTQVHIVAIDNTSEAQSLENIVVTQAHQLLIDQFYQYQSIESFAVTQDHYAELSDIFQLQLIEGPIMCAEITTGVVGLAGSVVPELITGSIIVSQFTQSIADGGPTSEIVSEKIEGVIIKNEFTVNI